LSGTVAALAVGAYSLAVDVDTADYGTVSIGDFVFDGWEVPESIKWGGTQRVNVHKLVGGDRVIDAMGPDHADISWSATMLSPDASLRADELDQMRISGQLFPIIFANRYYEGVISNFQADQRKAWHVPYNITLVVWRDQSFVAANPQPTALAAVTDDVSAGLAITSAGLATAATALALVSPILVSMSVIDQGAASTIALASNLTLASTAATAAASLANATIAGVTAGAVTTGIVAGTATVDTAITTLATVGQATQDAAAAAAMASYVSRASKNVANA
jgi:hypothetical protein